MNAITPTVAAATAGIWPTSSPVAFTSFAVFCVGNNKVREAMFKGWALGIGLPFKELVGSYKGVTEASFIVPFSRLVDVVEAGWIVGEESVLILGSRYVDGVMRGDRVAHLWFPSTGETVNLGHFGQTTKAHALAQEAWTFDPTDGTYWVCA
jgi:hypothetical protein